MNGRSRFWADARFINALHLTARVPAKGGLLSPLSLYPLRNRTGNNFGGTENFGSGKGNFRSNPKSSPDEVFGTHRHLSYIPRLALHLRCVCIDDLPMHAREKIDQQLALGRGEALEQLPFTRQ